ncbi:ketopantoate reductase family protein [Billgrantia montanilacus]|uniref:2-dehydropantoate 2-reductase n=1 Tax=Billgrantia montanilacus TaxID=2282305 RepID=A0A368TRG3_9GAMM|nr:2-dehydropantoate 2-reductase [Halomonas montanilacus]RCV87329.1 ketopantoate reductase family protein [Halomonas montanilacus]
MSTASHLIVGPGALGRLLALHLAGTQPVVLAGRRSLPAEQTLTTPAGEQRTCHLTMADSRQLPPLAPAFLHLTTKAYATESAYVSVAAQLPPATPLVLWQNGYQVQPTLSLRHTGPVLCASTTEGAWLSGDSGVVHAGYGLTYVGDLDNRYAELCRTLAATLTETGLQASAVDDIHIRLWHKLAINAAINPLAARYRIRNGQLRDRPFRPMVNQVIEEVAAIMAAEEIPAPASGWQGLVWQVVAGTANNRASMLQDVLAGRPTEREAILGPLLAAASLHRIATPVLVALDTALAEP